MQAHSHIYVRWRNYMGRGVSQRGAWSSAPASQADEVWVPGNPCVWGGSVPGVDIRHWLVRPPILCLGLQGALLRCPI